MCAICVKHRLWASYVRSVELLIYVPDDENPRKDDENGQRFDGIMCLTRFCLCLFENEKKTENPIWGFLV